MEPLVKAIIRHENGQQPYEDASYKRRPQVAGGISRQPSLSRPARTVQGGAGAAGWAQAITVDSVVEIARGAAVLDLGGIVPGGNRAGNRRLCSVHNLCADRDIGGMGGTVIAKIKYMR